MASPALGAVLPAVLGINNYHHLRGGSERYFLELGRLLHARGHRVTHLSTSHPRNEPAPGEALFLPPLDLEHPGPFGPARFLYSRAAARAVERLLASSAPDLAHLHIYYGQLTGSILAPLTRAGLPLVQTLHEYRTICPVHTLLSRGRPCEACAGRHFLRALPRRCNRGSLARTALNVAEVYLARSLGAVSGVRRFIAVSEFLRAKVIEHGLPPERVVTVPNFVDARAVEPASGPGRHLLYLGRLEAHKGVFTLLEAAAEAPALPLLIAGEGPARAQLERQIAGRRLDHVRLLGFQQGAALAALVRDCRCVVVPSEWLEPFGLAALEPLAAGRPVIASAIGALPEVVRHGEDGWLVPPGDAAALAERLRWMQAEPAQAAAMGARGRARVSEEFSPERHHEQLLAVYRSVL